MQSRLARLELAIQSTALSHVHDFQEVSGEAFQGQLLSSHDFRIALVLKFSYSISVTLTSYSPVRATV
jgi:hypothetical protein